MILKRKIEYDIITKFTKPGGNLEYGPALYNKTLNYNLDDLFHGIINIDKFFCKGNIQGRARISKNFFLNNRNIKIIY